MIGSPAPPWFESLVTALINKLAARVGDGCLELKNGEGESGPAMDGRIRAARGEAAGRLAIRFFRQRYGGSRRRRTVQVSDG
jgi:hypothetical protein